MGREFWEAFPFRPSGRGKKAAVRICSGPQSGIVPRIQGPSAGSGASAAFSAESALAAGTTALTAGKAALAAGTTALSAGKAALAAGKTALAAEAAHAAAHHLIGEGGDLLPVDVHGAAGKGGGAVIVESGAAVAQAVDFRAALMPSSEAWMSISPPRMRT